MLIWQNVAGNLPCTSMSSRGDSDTPSRILQRKPELSAGPTIKVFSSCSLKHSLIIPTYLSAKQGSRTKRHKIPSPVGTVGVWSTAPWFSPGEECSMNWCLWWMMRTQTGEAHASGLFVTCWRRTGSVESRNVRCREVCVDLVGGQEISAREGTVGLG